MSFQPTTYHRPESLAEAWALGRRLGPDGAFLAGGTELLPDFYRERETARELIALDALDALRGIGMEDGRLRIGALTTVAEVAASPLVRGWIPVLAEAARLLASPAIRSLATIGGNFCRAVPCADTPPAAIVGEAQVRLASAVGTRTLEAAAFFLGPRQTVLQPGELLVDLLIPEQPPGSGASYQRFARRRGSALPVAAVAARVTLRNGRIAEARLALGAVGPTPLVPAGAVALLQNEHPSTALFERAAVRCAEAALPISDLRGSAEFRRELVNRLARRALEDATIRARGEAP